MTIAIDAGVDFFRQALALRGYRQQLLSADIANASTPGFKAVDLDFRKALAAATPVAPAPVPVLLVDDARDIQIAGVDAPGGAAAAVGYQTGSSVTLDGNSVDLNQEKAAAGENAVQYEAAATFASQTLRLLTTAINGAQSSGGA